MRMTGSILVYGATGYTGKLVAQVSRAKGSNVILAGRSPEKVKAVAKPLGLPWRAFDLSDRREVDTGVKDVAVTAIANLSALDSDEFWTVMDNRNWMHPFDAVGVRRRYADIPK